MSSAKADKQVIVRGGVSGATLLVAIMLVLKCTGFFPYSWWWVFLPWWIGFAILIAIAVLSAGVFIIGWAVSKLFLRG